MATSKTWPGGGTGATPASYSIPDAGNLNWASLSDFLDALADGAQCTTFQKFAIRKATTSPVTVATSDCVVISQLAVAGAVTVNLPAGANKQVFIIVDGTGDANTNNITINRNGSDTIAGATSLILSGAGEAVFLVFNSGDTDWKIAARSNRAGSGVGGFTASRAIVSDGSGNLSVATTTSTQIGYLSSATGTTGTASTNIVFSTSPTLTTATLNSPTLVTPILGTPQSGTMTNVTGLPLTSGVTGILPVANGGTNSSTALNSNRFIVSSSGAIGEASAVTASRVVVSDSNGLPSAASTTTTQVNYISSATGTTGTTSTNIVFSTSPTLVTPVLGAATATSINGLTITSTTGGTLTLANSSTLATSGANSITLTSTGPTNVTLPTTGTVATLAGTEALTNKDYQGGTASNSLRFTCPNNTYSNLVALTRKEATLVYATDTDQLYADDGSNLNPIGSGAGEKNYLITGSSSAVGWTASGAGITVATSVTAAELPRENTTKSGIKITGVSGSTAYAYYRFTLDDVDWNRKCKIKFDLKPVSGYVASDMKVDLYSNTAANYGGTSTRIVTYADSSSICAIPNLTGQFQTSVDMPDSSAPYMELRIGLNASSTQAIVVSDVIVGPGIQPQGSVVQVPQSVTFTGSWVSNTTYTAIETRIGTWAKYEVKVLVSGAPTSANLTLTMPTGRTIDTNALTNTGTATGGNVLPNSNVSILDSGTQTYRGTVAYLSTTSVGIYYEDDAAAGVAASTAVTQAAPQTWASGDYAQISFMVPIAEWAGTGVVNLAQNDIEYVYNSGTWDATDSTSFAYGPAGQAMGGTLAANRTKTVRFQTPIQATDKVEVEVSENRTVWYPANGGRVNAATVIPTLDSTGNFLAGIAWDYVSGAPTDLKVIFGQYASLANDDSPGNDWPSSNGYWRVRKVSSGQAIGFSIATAGSTGLINYYQEDDTTCASVTFTGNGGGSSASSAVAIKITRIGRIVTITVPSVTDSTPAGGSTFLRSSVALPSWARPAAARVSNCGIRNNGAFVNNSVSQINVNTDGTIDVYRDIGGTAYTNSATAGFEAWSFSYTTT